MKYYAGLDVSMKETFICILDEEGKKMYESHVYIDPEYIAEELAKSGFTLEKVGLESGSYSNCLDQSFIRKRYIQKEFIVSLHECHKEGSKNLDFHDTTVS